MAVDLRQVMAAFLTFSMFVMLGNMIKRDHIDPFLESYPESPNLQYNSLKVSKHSSLKLTEISNGLRREDIQPMQPCWKKPSFREGKQSNHGYIFFSLSHGPEFHALQVTNAVAVARHLAANLAIPDIIVSNSGERKPFGEIYDVERFIESLKGVVRVYDNPSTESPDAKLTVVKVPERVSEAFIASRIRPIFRSKKNLKIVTFFNSSKRVEEDESSSPYRCIAMFESLKLQSELQQLVDSMVRTLRSLSQKTRGRFIAVDLRLENVQEIKDFLMKIGVDRGTSIYLTQTRWSSSINGLRDVFPNTFTKDAIMAADQKAIFMGYNKIINFYICIESDIFIPSITGTFSGGVIGKRIGQGRTNILFPAKNISDAVLKKRSHFAYSCFC